jgi:hypothetical protein
MTQVILWKEWSQAFSALRLAFSRQTTFFWAFIACAGMAIREDRAGVSSFVRVFGLKEVAYHGMLRMFHSTAVDLDKLMELWIHLCLKIFTPVCIDGFLVVIGDGVKVGKEGKKMPAVKVLHQESQSNSKAEFIMGHYLQAFSLLVVSPLGSLFGIPLIAQIHDGIKRSNRCKKTVIDRFISVFSKISDVAGHPAIIVADAYYAAKSTIGLLASTSCHLVTRVQHNAVAFDLVKKPLKRGRGRPQKYGPKIQLKTLFNKFSEIATVKDDTQYYSVDLHWSQAKTLVRFVLIEHKGKRFILMSTNLSIDPMTIIKLYRARTIIESSFKQSIHIIGTYGYHFWMKAMIPIRRCSKGQYLHRQPKIYRGKLNAS